MQKQGNDGANESIGHIFLCIPYITLSDEVYAILLTTENDHGKPFKDLIPGADGADKQESNEVTYVPG